MSELKASIVVDFGTSAADLDGILKAELYDEINPPSPFPLTAQVNFLVFSSANVFYNNPIPSSGTVAFQGTVTLDKEDDIVVTDATPQSLNYIPDGDVEFSWYGPEPVITKDANGDYTFTGEYPFIGKAKYKTTGDHYLLTPPVLASDVLEYKILVLILGGFINA